MSKVRTLQRRADHLAEQFKLSMSDESRSYVRAELEALRWVLGVVADAYPLLPIVEIDEPPVQWLPLAPTTDTIMTIQEFIEAVRTGQLEDGDGEGRCATETRVSDCRIYPSSLDRPSWTTHVSWCGK
jgi:hypothetical protein